MSEIQRFYADKNIFVTGVTGFLGTILVEKLLRSCPNIGKIYVLIRSKKGSSSRERMNVLLASAVFDGLRDKDPTIAKKMVAIDGDVSAKGLGMTVADRARIVNEVSVIFHLAATVRFDEILPRAVAMNVRGVKEIIDLGKECKMLQAAVYVSTAFSHCVRSKIEDKLYESPLTYDEITNITEIADKRNWSNEITQGIANKIIGDWPNTYTFTKAIAEGVVAEYAKGMPFSIFRPSIVVGSVREPLPGWVTNMMGVNGVLVGVGIGILHVMYLDVDAKCNVVPVDFTCNALISCAWETATNSKRFDQDTPAVYNFATTPEQSITWGQIHSMNQAYLGLTPPNSAIYYNSIVYTKSWTIYAFLEFWLHLIPALLIDYVGKLFGKRATMYKLHLKVAHLVRLLSFFTLREWDFDNRRTRSIWQKMSPEDKLTFPFNLESVDWHEHTKAQIRAIRKFVLGESDDNMDRAKRRRTILYIVHTIVRLLFLFVVLWMVWKAISLVYPSN